MIKCLMILFCIYMLVFDPFSQIVISVTIIFIDIYSIIERNFPHLCIGYFNKHSDNYEII